MLALSVLLLFRLLLGVLQSHSVVYYTTYHSVGVYYTMRAQNQAHIQAHKKKEEQCTILSEFGGTEERGDPERLLAAFHSLVVAWHVGFEER